MIPSDIYKRLHLCTSLAAVIPSCLHCHRQIIRPAECGDEQRHEKRNHIFCFLHQIAGLKIRAAGHLRLHDFIGLIQQNRNETQCDRHHHRDIVYRNVKPSQRAHRLFQTVRQIVWRGRQCHDRRADDQVNEANRHRHRRLDTLPRDRQLPEMNDRRTRNQEQIEDDRDQKQQDDRLQAAHHKAKRHL